MTTMNISLPEELKTFIDEQVAGGGYSSTSEYVRALIRDARKAAARQRLEALLLEGINSGDPVEVTPEFWHDVRQQALAKIESGKRGDGEGQ